MYPRFEEEKICATLAKIFSMISSDNIIIWDWNGTLLNDVEISIIAMNSMLQERHLPLLTETIYKDVFCFPVRQYYEKIGFNFEQESFETVGLDYMDRYRDLSHQALLADDAVEVLTKLQELGCRQLVLSSMKQALLQKMLKDYGIFHFFSNVYGIENDYGGGKIELGIRMLKELSINTQRTIMIGDTLHDAEVADKMKIHCVLFSGGHQSLKRCLSSNKTVINDLRSILCCDNHCTDIQEIIK